MIASIAGWPGTSLRCLLFVTAHSETSLWSFAHNLRIWQYRTPWYHFEDSGNGSSRDTHSITLLKSAMHWWKAGTIWSCGQRYLTRGGLRSCRTAFLVTYNLVWQDGNYEIFSIQSSWQMVIILLSRELAESHSSLGTWKYVSLREIQNRTSRRAFPRNTAII